MASHHQKGCRESEGERVFTKQTVKRATLSDVFVSIDKMLVLRSTVSRHHTQNDMNLILTSVYVMTPQVCDS